MDLKNCILIENDCYKAAKRIEDNKPVGIVVHSTGANNPRLKRYIQPVPGQSNYNDILSDLGKNIYENHWNQTRVYHYYDGTSTVGTRDISNKLRSTDYEVCVHAFIGKTASGLIAAYQTLPFDFCCWGCGRGKNGSYNYNPTARVQFEICEDSLCDKKYFSAVFKEAAEFCAYICRQYDISPSTISSHAEAHRDGYASNHGDPENWLRKYNMTMDDFRIMVKQII